MRKVREVTNKIYEAMEEGTLSAYQVAQAALNYMSEAEVAQMAEANDFFDGPEDDEDWDDEDWDEEYLYDDEA